MPRENLYFIAIFPPKEISEQIHSFKKDIAQRFGSKAALKIDPHITLKAPFGLPPHMQDDLTDWFESLKITISPFKIALKNFGCFEKKSVLFVQPELDPALHSLQQEILKQFREIFKSVVVMDPDFRFKPHITIGYRDWETDQFMSAWKEYSKKKYETFFDVNEFHLLQHDGIKWFKIATKVL